MGILTVAIWAVAPLLLVSSLSLLRPVGRAGPHCGGETLWLRSRSLTPPFEPVLVRRWRLGCGWGGLACAAGRQPRGASASVPGGETAVDPTPAEWVP